MDQVDKLADNTTWCGTCIIKLRNASPLLAEGLVDSKGESMPIFSSSTWGVNIATCKKYCNDWAPFNFPKFASGMTNYLLPWFALTAQLPYQTDTRLNDIWSFCLAVGSPALVSMKERFFKHANENDPVLEYMDHVNGAQMLLQEAQQLPLRASQEKRWLSSLIVLPENKEWWAGVEGTLSLNRRHFTFSIVAQFVLALTTWSLTFASAFTSKSGSASVALGFSGGSLWLWLIPVIWGWVVVGTQHDSKALKTTIEASKAHRELNINDGNYASEKGIQKGITIPQNGLVPQLVEPHWQTSVGQFETEDAARLKIPLYGGVNLRGDEAILGPVFNYARVFTWWQFATTMEQAMQKTLERARKSDPRSNTARMCGVVQESCEGGHKSISNGNHSHYKKAYPEKIPGILQVHISIACFFALFVQGGTTSAAVLSAYYTPVVGFGCRSGAYLLYGSIGTAAWLFLSFSALMSQYVMARYQDDLLHHADIDFRHSGIDDTQRESSVGSGFNWLRALAVYSRAFGRFLAAGNTLFVIVISCAEIAGGYETCWCNGTQLNLKSKAWIILFRTEHEWMDMVKKPWLLGFWYGVGVSLVAMLFLWLCRYINDIPRWTQSCFKRFKSNPEQPKSPDG